MRASDGGHVGIRGGAEALGLCRVLGITRRHREGVAQEVLARGVFVQPPQQVGHGRVQLVLAHHRRVHEHGRTQLGLPLADALAAWPAEHDAPGVRAAAGALAVATTVGGRAADAIDGLAASLRDRLDAMAEARSLSAQARLSAVVVGAAPLGYLAFAALVDPGAVTALVSTGVGRVCLAVGLGLEALAALWIRRILRSAG